MTDDRRPMTDDEMDLALSESGYPPVRYRAVKPEPWDFVPDWYVEAQAARESGACTPMCGIPADEDRPDRGMQGIAILLLFGILLTAVIVVGALMAALK